jgi:hypothetical protein
MEEVPVEILGVAFLTPALIKLKLGDREEAVQVSIDIVNRKVYYGNSELYSTEVFQYLDAVNTLPDDFFAAPDDIVEQAAQAREDHEKLRQQHVEG